MGEEREVRSRKQGRFIAEGTQVLKEGDETHYADGTRGISLTIPVCETWEHLTDREGVAKMIADALNAANVAEPPNA